MDLILAIAAGLAVGGGVVWVYLREQTLCAFERGKTSMQPEHAALTERLAGRDAAVEKLEKRVLDLEASRETAEAELRAEAEKRAAAQQLAARVPQLEDALKEAGRMAEAKEMSIAEQKAENARLKAELEAERAMLTEKLSCSQSRPGATR